MTEKVRACEVCNSEFVPWRYGGRFCWVCSPSNTTRPSSNTRTQANVAEGMLQNAAPQILEALCVVLNYLTDSTVRGSARTTYKAAVIQDIKDVIFTAMGRRP